MLRKKIIFLFGFIFLLTSIYFAVEYVFIPKNIYMTAGESYVMNISAPFDAEIESNEAVSINNEKVSENIEVSLNDDNLISSASNTVANLKVKLMGMPVKKVQLYFLPEKKVEVIGKTVGICVDTKGVLVLGIGNVKCVDSSLCAPCRNILKSGDIIMSIDGKDVDSKEGLAQLINTDKAVNVGILRNDESMSFQLTPVMSADDGTYKLGLWVRDSTQGIGTITYYDRETNTFGALGHPINDVDTGKLMEIDGGEILEAKVDKAEKGRSGYPGSLVGNIYFDKTIGYVESNMNNGIFGQMCSEIEGVEMPIGYKNDVKVGNASIFVDIGSGFVDEYSVYIDSINKYNTNDTKNFILTITDTNLLNKTGGIVQGMSGCPIVQNGKLVGAVTHVFVNDPTRGYGIFIENMINFEKKY